MSEETVWDPEAAAFMGGKTASSPAPLPRGLLGMMAPTCLDDGGEYLLLPPSGEMVENLTVTFRSRIMPLMNYRDYITLEPNKRGGKPCVRGLRISVYEVLEYLASEMTEQEILEDFPDLTHEDLKACLAYAADRERRFMTSP